jgi:hypothetical protein
VCVNSASTVLRGAGVNWCVIGIVRHRRGNQAETQTRRSIMYPEVAGLLAGDKLESTESQGNNGTGC